MRTFLLLFLVALSTNACGNGPFWCTHFCNEPGMYTDAGCGCSKLNEDTAGNTVGGFAQADCACDHPTLGRRVAFLNQPSAWGSTGDLEFFAPTCRDIFLCPNAETSTLLTGVVRLRIDNASQWTSWTPATPAGWGNTLYYGIGTPLPPLRSLTYLMQQRSVPSIPASSVRYSMLSSTIEHALPARTISPRGLASSLTCSEVCNSSDQDTAAHCMSLSSQKLGQLGGSLRWLAEEVGAERFPISPGDVLTRFGEANDPCGRSALSLTGDVLDNIGEACQARFVFAGGAVSGVMRLGQVVRAKIDRGFDRHRLVFQGDWPIVIGFEQEGLQNDWGGAIREIEFVGTSTTARIEDKACIRLVEP